MFGKPPAPAARSFTNRFFRPRLEALEDRLAPAVLPAGFTEATIAGGIGSATAFELAPDGRIFVAEQTGDLRVVSGGVLRTTPFLHVNVDAAGERGLIGVTVDPNYLQNHFVYVYYTVPGSPAHNRISRFTANGDVAVAGSETVLMDLDNLSTATNHNGGALHFGGDGKLYVGVGDNANGSNAQTLTNRLGKMLRLNADGSIPTDNPFVNTATGANRAIWALGLRNPFTFGVQAGTGRLFINDVGQNTWEEIDDGIAGSNYGWPTTEGPTSDPRFRGPLYAYMHGTGTFEGNAIVGGAFYNPATVRFPSQYVGSYFFADLTGGWIHRYDPATGNVTEFATGINSPTDLRVSADGRLFYLSRGAGTVMAISALGTDLNGLTVGAIASAFTSQSFRVARSYTVANAPAANSFFIRYYASKDTTFGNGDDIQVGSELITAAADKTVGTHNGLTPLLKIGRPGAQYLFAYLDTSGNVAEVSETNNAFRSAGQMQISGPVDLVIDNFTPSYSEAGAWTHLYNRGFDDTLSYTAPGTGSRTVTWNTGVGPGTYLIQATWYAQSYWASNATYRFLDGGDPRGSATVNQQVLPVGTQINGWIFQTLARVDVGFGNLQVVLSNATDKFVMADAIRIVQVFPTDLGGLTVTVPANADTQQTFQAARSYTISRNAVGNDFFIRYYASTDRVFGNADDLIVGTELVNTTAGKTIGTHSGLTPPLRIGRPGAQFLFAYLDTSGSVAEDDETNNLFASAGSINVTGPVDAVVDTFDPGYAEAGVGWQHVYVTGYGNQLSYQAAGGGDRTATWQLRNLPAGTYDVQVTWYAQSYWATNAPFRIFDGATLLAAVAVNQRVNPVGTTVGGAVFQTLARVTVSSGTVRVVLSNLADGYVMADAVRIQQVA
jgi:glucose/arabinose dehydrogenase